MVCGNFRIDHYSSLIREIREVGLGIFDYAVRCIGIYHLEGSPRIGPTKVGQAVFVLHLVVKVELIELLEFVLLLFFLCALDLREIDRSEIF